MTSKDIEEAKHRYFDAPVPIERSVLNSQRERLAERGELFTVDQIDYVLRCIFYGYDPEECTDGELILYSHLKNILENELSEMATFYEWMSDRYDPAMTDIAILLKHIFSVIIGYSICDHECWIENNDHI